MKIAEIFCPLLKAASVYKTLKNPTINLKGQNNRQKPFPAKNSIQINNTFAIGS